MSNTLPSGVDFNHCMDIIMTARTREGALGLSGRQGTSQNKQDSFIKFFEADLPIVASTSEQDTNVTLPLQGVVIPGMCYVRTTTAEATATVKTVDIGITGNPDAIIDGGSVAALGSVGITGGGGELPSIPCAGLNITYALTATNYAEMEARVVIAVMGSDK